MIRSFGVPQFLFSRWYSGGLFSIFRKAPTSFEVVGRLSLAVFSLSLVMNLLFNGCQISKAPVAPRIEFTTVPPAVAGGPDRLDAIEGHVTNAKPGERVVLYARTPEFWWVQPFAAKPFTEIQSNLSWRSSTHLGTEYAALVVTPAYLPPQKSRTLPGKSDAVLAVAVTRGSRYVHKIIHFSGYDWEISQLPNNRGGKMNVYDAANAWTDADGFLHLRIVRRGDAWACAEVALSHALGQGTYYFTVRDVSRLDPAAVLTLYTFDPAQRFHGEVDVEVSRWGRVASKNAQYVIQPYYEPSNVDRFEAPSGRLTFSFHWEPGEAHFTMVRGRDVSLRSRVIAEHVFTSGVPVSEGASIHMNLYAFGNAKTPMQGGAEVVIEKFGYFP